MGLVAKAFQDIITFSRASSGTYVNSNGYITNSSVLNYLTYSNQPENGAWTKSNSFVQQNLLTYSQEFDNAAWVKSAGISAFGSGSVVNAATAPDGTQTADLIVESAAGAGSIQHSFYQTFSVSAGTYTLTIFAKPASGATRYLSIYPQGAGTAYAVFNLASQTVSFTGGANYLSSSIVAANNGFYRCVITFSAIAGTIFTSAYISDSAVAQAPSYVGDGASGFYIWGAQCVQGSVPGDYRATTTAALPCLYADYNGALRARKLCEAATTGTHSILQNNTITGGVIATNSIYVKAAERTQCRVINYDNAANYAFVYVNLSNGSIVSSGITGTVSSQSFSVEPAENGWYRISVAASLTSTTRQLRVDTAVGGSENTTGDGSSGIYIADAQLNDGSSALAYYNTDASAYNAPRFDYDPVTLAAKGLLVEEQRANLLLRSNDWSATWSNTNITLGASILAPDGTTTATRLQATASAVTSSTQNVTATATSHTYSIYAKQGSAATDANTFILRNFTTSTNLAVLTIDYSTGVITQTTGTGATATNAGNGFWRIVIPATSGITIGNTLIAYACYSGASETAGEYAYVWGAQLEAGAFATSYIPTVASQVTRAADVASVNTLSPWYNSAAGTLFVQALRAAVNPSAAPNAFEIGDGTNNNRLLIYNPVGGTTSEFYVANGGVVQAQISVASAFQANVVGKVAGAYQANDFQQASNGTLGTADTSGTLPAVTAAYIGRNGAGTVFWSGWIQRITYYPRRLTNAELQTLTTL